MTSLVTLSNDDFQGLERKKNKYRGTCAVCVCERKQDEMEERENARRVKQHLNTKLTAHKMMHHQRLKGTNTIILAKQKRLKRCVCVNQFLKVCVSSMQEGAQGNTDVGESRSRSRSRSRRGAKETLGWVKGKQHLFRGPRLQPSHR